MPYPSPAELVVAVDYERSMWDRNAILPVKYKEAQLAIQSTKDMPTNVSHAIALAVNGNSHSYNAQAVLGATLQSYGANIEFELRRSILGFRISLNVGMIGYIDNVVRVVFMTTRFAYGNLRRASEEEILRFTERGATDLQINELLAILVAAQCQLHDESINPQEILFMIPTPGIDKIYYATVTPTKDMVITSANYHKPMTEFQMSKWNGVTLTPGNSEIYALVHSFLGEPKK